MSFEQQAKAAELLQELQANPQAVELVPAPRQQWPGHCIRVAVGVRPAWYSQYFAEVGYLDHRRLASAFLRMASGQPVRTQYDHHAAAIIDRELQYDESPLP